MTTHTQAIELLRGIVRDFLEIHQDEPNRPSVRAGREALADTDSIEVPTSEPVQASEAVGAVLFYKQKCSSTWIEADNDLAWLRNDPRLIDLFDIRTLYTAPAAPTDAKPVRGASIDTPAFRRQLHIMLSAASWEEGTEELLTPFIAHINAWHARQSASVEDASRLLKAAKVYAFNYCQDEAESEEDCVCGPKQHAEAIELFAAIAAMTNDSDASTGKYGGESAS